MPLYLLSWCYAHQALSVLLPLQYASSRPPSAETQYSARLGSRSNSVSSHVRPHLDLRPLSLRYSSPQRSSYLSSEGPQSPVYNMPYTSVVRNSPLQHAEKAPLIKVKPVSVVMSHNKADEHLNHCMLLCKEDFYWFNGVIKAFSLY